MRTMAEEGFYCKHWNLLTGIIMQQDDSFDFFPVLFMFPYYLCFKMFVCLFIVCLLRGIDWTSALKTPSKHINISFN